MPTEEEILTAPMTGETFNEISRSAHAFWTMNLASECHPQAGIDPTYHSGLQSGGTVRLCCHECKALIGVVLVAKRLPSQDTAVLKGLVAGLPTCNKCSAPATKRVPPGLVARHFCDEHAYEYESAADLPWAETIRSLSER